MKRCPRVVLVDLERPVEPCLTPPRALLTCRVVVFCAEFPQSEAYIACVKYVHKYISKPDRFVTSRLHCAAKWHEQARMLSHALPVDVVRVIGAHVCERAAHRCPESEEAVRLLVVRRPETHEWY